MKTEVSMQATKFDSGKPPVGLIPQQALLAEARVMAFGAEKYGRDNWRKGMDWSRLTDAALRHLLAFIDGETLDPETGLPHLAHVRCCTAFLLTYAAQNLGRDDRYINKTGDGNAIKNVPERDGHSGVRVQG